MRVLRAEKAGIQLGRTKGMKQRIKKSRKKFWVLSRAYSTILALCKTEGQARRLREQDEEFRGASINSVYLCEPAGKPPGKPSRRRQAPPLAVVGRDGGP